MSKNNIHPTAIIEGDVTLGEGNIIHPYVVISGKIKIGNNNVIGPGTYITNNVEIGSNNQFTAYDAVGTLGEMGTKGDVFVEDGGIFIGDNNTFREFITVQSPVRRKETRVGNNCYIMNKCHIAHDTQVADFVVMATGSIIGGGDIIQRNAYIGLGSITHQWLTIGESAMIGMNAVNVKNVPPYTVVAGVPSKIIGFNKVGAERRGHDADLIKAVTEDFKNIISSSSSLDNEVTRLIRSFQQSNENVLLAFH